VSRAKIPIEIDGVKEDLIFEGGEDYSYFNGFVQTCMFELFHVKTYNQFIYRAKRIDKVILHDERHRKWRTHFLKQQEAKFLDRNKQKKGFNPIEPKVIKGSMKGVLSQLKEYPINEAIVLKLTEMVRDDYFDRGSIKVKGFFTFFSIELFGPDKKTSLYNAYRDLLKEGRPKLLE
jgi:hypothetical protein